MPTLTQEELMDAICNLTLMQAAELTKALEEKLGVSAAAPVAAVAMPVAGAAGGGAAAAEEEKTSFDIELASVKADANKVQVIKVVREFTTHGLKEAKELVDGAPKVIKEGVTKEEAEKMKARFAEVGAEIKLK
ncbi:MAG: 50S ribosomal protein L7/L12 [Proteobacteria bacterium]|nr:50S ribosomal protein L7/L12 [Pseudomonadota bacterium]